MRFLTIYWKTLADLSNPKLLAGYFVPFLTLAAFLALGLTNDELSGSVSIAQQETELFGSFMVMSFILAAGIPFLALAAVISANTLAKEAEQGTLRILLSKPTRRWEVLLGTFGAVVTYSGLVALASLLLSAILLVEMGDISTTAISAGIFAPMPGSITFAVFGTSVVTAVGLALAVFTQNQLRSALGALVVPILYFAFLPIRIFSGEMYEDYFLYLLDVNYHFGNVFVLIHETIGEGFGVETQEKIALWTGVYELPEGEPYQHLESLETVGLVPMEVSVLLLLLLAITPIAGAVYRFQQMDV